VSFLCACTQRARAYLLYTGSHYDVLTRAGGGGSLFTPGDVSADAAAASAAAVAEEARQAELRQRCRKCIRCAGCGLVLAGDSRAFQARAARGVRGLCVGRSSKIRLAVRLAAPRASSCTARVWSTTRTSGMTAMKSRWHSRRDRSAPTPPLDSLRLLLS